MSGRSTGYLRSRDAELYGSTDHAAHDRSMRPMRREREGPSPIRATVTASGPIRFPVSVVLDTLIVDRLGQGVADTAAGDWGQGKRSRKGKCAGKWGAYGAEANAERMAELINAGAVAKGLIGEEELKGAGCGQ